MPQHYVGSIDKFGVDIGFTKGGVVVWAVFAPTTSPEPALWPDPMVGYGSATAVVGAGANVLVGGSNKTISLSRSHRGEHRVNIAAGVAALTLTYQPG